MQIYPPIPETISSINQIKTIEGIHSQLCEIIDLLIDSPENFRGLGNFYNHRLYCEQSFEHFVLH